MLRCVYVPLKSWVSQVIKHTVLLSYGFLRIWRTITPTTWHCDGIWACLYDYWLREWDRIRSMSSGLMNHVLGTRKNYHRTKDSALTSHSRRGVACIVHSNIDERACKENCHIPGKAAKLFYQFEKREVCLQFSRVLSAQPYAAMDVVSKSFMKAIMI